MKREFLEGLGLEKEAIDKIMAENGSDIEKQKQETVKVSEELSGIKAQLEDANKAIKGFEDLDVEGIKKAAQDWESKYKTDTETLKKQIDQKDYEHAAEAYLNGFKFTSDLAKKAVLLEFREKEFKLEDGKFLGADDYMTQLKESNPAAFDGDKPALPKIITGQKGSPIGMGVTKEQFKTMSYMEKFKIKTEQPDVYKTLVE